MNRHTLTHQARPRIGWIGTGVMGSSMAGRLLAAGYPLWVTTRTRARAATLVDAGATWCETPAELAASAEVVCSMVGLPADVEAVWLGPDGVLGGDPATSIIEIGVDLTTSSPDLAARLASVAAERGVSMLDAPVSGGDIGARNGTLSIMVGGAAAALETVRPVLQQLGQTIIRQGDPGTGQHTKLVNQILIAGNMMGVCEGLLYARRSGLDPATVLQSVGGGAAASWSLANLAPRILQGDHAPGFLVEHFLKDMAIALAEAERLHLSLPALALAKQLYEALRAQGGANQGTQALYRVLAGLSGM